MWFQRHEEPKQITDDYEQVFFDFLKIILKVRTYRDGFIGIVVKK